MTSSSSLRRAILAAVCIVVTGFAHPAQAGRTHGPHGRHGGHVGATIGNAQGGITHARGTKVSGPSGHASRAAHTSVDPDGVIRHQGSSRVVGARGGSFNAGNSYMRNPDGSAQASHQRSGTTAAGGSLANSGSASRSADGTWTAQRQRNASGSRGNYQGSTSAEEGSMTHVSHITGPQGNGYDGETSYARGEGITHSHSCHDAQGHPIGC